jgi:hypothetical protein
MPNFAKESTVVPRIGDGLGQLLLYLGTTVLTVSQLGMK